MMGYPIRVRASALIVRDGAVLVVEFNDETGLHYNLPAGGVEKGESVVQAVKREAKEEASVDVEVGRLTFVYEYQPGLNTFEYGQIHTLDFIFECKLAAHNACPKMPERPDPHQTAVKWVNLAELASVNLLPRIGTHIIQYARGDCPGLVFIEEHRL